MKVLTPCYLSLGSNVGDSRLHLAEARQSIEGMAGSIAGASSLYHTAPWGKPDQPDFINQVLHIATKLDPHALLDVLQNIELSRGRTRDVAWGPRTIDIDILFYGSQVLQTVGLTIPHPRMHERKFVLIPLCELAPDFEHPILKKTTAELLRECADSLEVKRLD